MRWVILIVLSLASLIVRAEPRPFITGSFGQIVSADGPLIVRFWSIDCSYCLKEMPDLKALMVRHPGWTLALVCTDHPDMGVEAAKALRRAGLEPDRTWIFADPHVQRLRYDVDPKWYGELPRTYLYRAGRRLVAISGPIEAAAIGKYFGESK